MSEIKFNTIKPSAKSVFDMKHVKSVSAVCLLLNGRVAGRIVANWSDNPAGTVCTVRIGIQAGPFSEMPVVQARAGGFGYDKFSTACATALLSVLHKNNTELRKLAEKMDGAGESRVAAFFQSFGYDYVSII